MSMWIQVPFAILFALGVCYVHAMLHNRDGEINAAVVRVWSWLRGKR